MNSQSGPFLAVLAVLALAASTASAGSAAIANEQALRQSVSVEIQVKGIGEALLRANARGGKQSTVILFTGPQTPDKFLAAQRLGRQLGRTVLRVDLSTVVSKYAGEAEKNLARVFDAAASSSVVLFIDEADALFGNRTTVKDERPRYPNTEISYLLKRIEEYQDLVILSSNIQETARAIRHAQSVEFTPQVSPRWPTHP